MKAHHSFAFLIHRLMYTDKDAETEIIRLDTPCVEKMMDVLRSSVNGAAHGDDGLVQGSGQHRRPMTAAGARSQKNQESVFIWHLKGLAAAGALDACSVPGPRARKLRLPGQHHLTGTIFKRQKVSPMPGGPTRLGRWGVVRYLQPFFFRMFPRMTSALQERERRSHPT